MPHVHLFTFRMRDFSAAIGTRQGGLAMPLQPFLCRITSSLAILFLGKDADIERCEQGKGQCFYRHEDAVYG